MLQEAVSLRDIDDVEGFVAAAHQRIVRRYRLRVTAAEREELLAEGLAALYELERRFQPRRSGYGRAGRFSGYASVLLHRRLIDAWRSWHPEHRRVVENGTRHWEYGERPLSLDATLGPTGPKRGPDAQPQAPPHRPIRLWETIASANCDPARIGSPALDAALERLEPWERLGARRMVALFDEGFCLAEVAERLGLDEGRLRRLRDRLGAALRTVRLPVAA